MKSEHRDLAWRKGNFGRLLNQAIARFEARVFAILAEEGLGEVTQANLHLTRNLDIEGTRITELAARAAMTKQAMSEIVARCEASGLVTRMADPVDSRARKVVFTQKGLTWLEAFGRALQQAEREVRDEVGPEATDALRQGLMQYVARDHD